MINNLLESIDKLDWVALIPAIFAGGLFIINFLLYLVNRKTLMLLCRKPKIEITEISVRPQEKNGAGRLRSDCFITIQVFNPSSFGNYISGTLQKSRFSEPLCTKIYRRGIQFQKGDHCELPSFGKIIAAMYPKYEKVKKYENKKLLLTTKDIRGKKSRKCFVFKNIP